MTKKDFYLKALMSLANGIPFTASLNNDDDLSVSWETVQNKTAPTDAEIEAEVARLQAEYEAKEYQRNRASEYPAVGDQLDALWKGGDAAAEMLAKVQAVKAKYPKVGE
jgi:hypothetical protein